MTGPERMGSKTTLYVLSFHMLGLPVWAWCLLFFSPDLSMLGYLINTRFGALLYNVFHHKAVAIVIAAIGYWIHGVAHRCRHFTFCPFHF
jgi:hypothetical protein